MGSYLLDVSERNKTPALASCTNYLSLRIEALCEILVHAAVSSRTHLRVTLIQQHAIQTLRFKTAGPLVTWFTVAFGDLRDVSCVNLHTPNWFVDLQKSGWHSLDKTAFKKDM